MFNIKKRLLARQLSKGYKKWLQAHPEAMEENNRVLNEIGKLLGEKITKKDFFYESIELSPSDHKTKQIVIKAMPEMIQLIDRFLLDNNIVSLKEKTCLRINCLKR